MKKIGLSRRRCDVCKDDDALHKGDVCVTCNTGHARQRDVRFDQFKMARRRDGKLK